MSYVTCSMLCFICSMMCLSYVQLRPYAHRLNNSGEVVHKLAHDLICHRCGGRHCMHSKGRERLSYVRRPVGWTARLERRRGVMSVQRKSFVFSTDVSERLERLANTTRLETNSSVVRLALVVLEDLVEAIARGEKITIEDEAGRTRSYNPFVAPGRIEKGKPGQSRDAA